MTMLSQTRRLAAPNEAQYGEKWIVSFTPGQSILEINCGTGIDALHLASRGVRVDAFDAAPGMIARANGERTYMSGLHACPLPVPDHRRESTNSRQINPTTESYPIFPG